MTDGFRNGSKLRERGKRFLLVLRQRDVARQAEHLEELNGLLIDIGEDESRAGGLDRINDAQQNRDADAVDQLSLTEVDNKSATASFQLPTAFTLNAFAAQFVQIVPGINYRQVSD